MSLHRGRDELPRLLGVLSVDTLQLSAPSGNASAAESCPAPGPSVLEAAHPMADQHGGREACLWAQQGTILQGWSSSRAPLG